MNGYATTCHQVERAQVMPTATSAQMDLSVGGGGLCEVKRHMESKHHKDGTKAFTNQATMTSLLSQKKQSLNEQVTTAELFHSRA